MSIQRIVLKDPSLIVPKEWPITANFARWKGKEDICTVGSRDLNARKICTNRCFLF